MMSHAVETVGSEFPNRPDVGFVRRAVGVLIGALVGIAVERLGVLLLPRPNLILIDPDGFILDPALESVKSLAGVVGTDAGAESIIPIVEPANEVVSTNSAVGQQRAPMQTAAVEHGYRVIPTYDHEIDAGGEGVGRLAIGQILPTGDPCLLHTVSFRRVWKGIE